jgi:adenine-specific DNA methylase
MLFGANGERWRVAVPDGLDNKSALLLAQSSEELSGVPGGRFAHVVTDPPYYGNVMYAELADFYYVWLRPLLIERYPTEFRGERTKWEWLTPKSEAAVDQASRAASLSEDDLRRSPEERAKLRRERLHERGLDFLTKDEIFFVSMLTRIFCAARERLEDDGLVVFTFHHQQNEARSSVLRTVLDAGFYARAGTSSLGTIWPSSTSTITVSPSRNCPSRMPLEIGFSTKR